MRVKRSVATEDFAALPCELVQLIFKAPPEAFDRFESYQHIDWLKLRLRGLAVCRSWRAALSQLPLEVVRVDHDYDGRSADVQGAVARWLISAQPRVEHLVLDGSSVFRPFDDVKALVLVAAVLHSVAHKELKVLHYGCPQHCLSNALPCPAVLSSLAELRLKEMEFHPDWLAQLAALPALRLLELCPCCPSEEYALHKDPGEPVLLPRLPQITQLVMRSEMDAIPIRIVLSDLPSLQVLDLRLVGPLEILTTQSSSASRGSGASRASAPGPLPSSITHLALDNHDDCRVDFGALPALRSARLHCPQLRHPATLARCAQLRELRLGEVEEEDCEDEAILGSWAVALLQHAPRQLSKLTLFGDWDKEVAAALAPLSQLRTLSLCGYDRQPVPPATAAVWRGLRAMQLRSSDCPLKVPAGLRHAKLLERLELRHRNPSQATLKLLASLPRLRHLWLAPSGWDDSNTCDLRPLLDPGVERAVRSVLPRLASVRVEGWEDGD